ncbi:hypothetical protein [Labrys neptuniae]
MTHLQLRSFTRLKQLIEEQEAQGIRVRFQGWSIRLSNGEYVRGPHTEYGITRQRILVTQDRADAARIACRNRGELVEFWVTPKVTLAIVRKGGEALRWDAMIAP